MGDTGLECVPPLCWLSLKQSQLRHHRVPCVFARQPFANQENGTCLSVVAARKRRWFQVTGFLSMSLRFFWSLKGNLSPLPTGSMTSTHGPLIYQILFDLVPIVSDIERASMRYLWPLCIGMEKDWQSMHRTSLAQTPPQSPKKRFA